MSETIDHAKEAMEHAHEAHAQHGDTGARRVAVLIAILAALLALAEMQEKSSQNAYLTHHISLSDDWNFYQAKRARQAMLQSEADLLESLPNAADPKVAGRAADARARAAVLGDDPKGGEGLKQLLERAQQQTEQRNEAFHRYHQFELVVGALQIAIVLASVSVVTRMRAFAFVAGALGGVATVFGGLVAGGAL